MVASGGIVWFSCQWTACLFRTIEIGVCVCVVVVVDLLGCGCGCG